MYAKLFSSLYQGTLRGCADEILVFTNLLAHADATGLVDKHWRAISEETGISEERVKAAIANLEAPDPESRSPEMEGRRIIPLDEHRAWGWHIVNHGKYRAIRNEDDRREQNRLAQQRWRDKQKVSDVSRVSQYKPKQKQQADTEAEENTQGRESDDTTIQLGKIITGVKKELGLKKLGLTEERSWSNVAFLALENEFSAAEFLECFSLMRKQKWRTGIITPEQVSKNLPNLKNLRIEVGKQPKPEKELPLVADMLKTQTLEGLQRPTK